MNDLKGAIEKKNRILSIIRLCGPSLPVQIAKSIETDGLFASAFLAELSSEKKIKMSYMKVGSSPLYYLDGQAHLLENFIQHLNSREREAFYLLKEKKILEDRKLEPVVRVALGLIKDFAIPIKVRVAEDVKTFWKYFLLSDSEVQLMLKEILIGKKIDKKKGIVEETTKLESKEALDKKGPIKEEIPKEKLKEEKVERKIKPKKRIVKKEKEEKPNEFFEKIKYYLQNKDIELIEKFLDKKKEFMARIRIDMIFGKQELLLVGKDKKNITDTDLTLALQKAQNEKMPVLFVSSGELNKRGKECLKDWRNFVWFEKL